MATQCVGTIANMMMDARGPDDDRLLVKHVMVYVCEQNPNVDKWKLEIFSSLGGKRHLFCKCSQFPLIPSKRPREKKTKCVMCAKRLETYVCCNDTCHIALCRS